MSEDERIEDTMARNQEFRKIFATVKEDDIRAMFDSGGIGFAPKFQWPKMNPTPYVKFSDPKGKDAIEVGLKWRF